MGGRRTGVPHPDDELRATFGKQRIGPPRVAPDLDRPAHRERPARRRQGDADTVPDAERRDQRGAAGERKDDEEERDSEEPLHVAMLSRKYFRLQSYRWSVKPQTIGVRLEISD